MQLELAHHACAQTPGGAVALAPRDGALLAWLALEGPTSRARLAGLLWPGSDLDAARNALRQRLHQLRRLVGSELVSGSGTGLLALADGVEHDLEDSDSVLSDVPDEIGGEFSAWLEQQRGRRRGRMRVSLVELSEMAEQAQDWADALGHAQELLALEPLSEDAHRRVMRLHYLRGDRPAALLAFDRCERLLKDEVGTAPSAETLALLGIVEGASASNGLRPRVLPASLRRPPREVGRESDQHALLAAWNAGLRFLVVGEPGIGKSRLLDSLCAVWQNTLVVRARPGDAGVPLTLIARLVEALGAAQAAWLRRPAAAELRTMLGAPAASSPVAPRAAPRPLRPLLIEALLPGEDALPALIFDDWQFADDASVDLLGDVLDAASLVSLRLGVASRTSAGPVADVRIARLRQRGDLRVVALEALGPHAVTELLESLQLGAIDVPGVAAALVQRVGGNPLFLLEALRHMLEASTVLLPRHVVVPHHVKDMVAQRLALLPPPARQLLRAAAVAGSDFSAELAEAVTGRHALELAESWALLEQQGLFGAQGIGHDVYAEAVLEDLPQAIGRLLHARVAAWLEGKGCEPARLAAHWRAGGHDDRAVVHLVAAGRRAWLAARAVDAFDLLSQAAEIEASRGDGDAAFELWFDNADAMTEIGYPALTQRCLAGMVEHARNERQLLRLRMARAAVRAALGEVEAGLGEMMGLIGDAIALGDVRVEAECRFAVASRAAADGCFDEALQHLAAGERVLRDAGDLRRAGSLSASMALVLGLRGQPRLAQREQARVLPLLAAESDLATWTVVCSSMALQYAHLGEVRQALQEVGRVRASTAQASIAASDTALIMRHLVDTLRWSGRFAEALQVCDEFGALLARQGDLVRACGPAAALHLQLGRSDLSAPLVDALAVKAPARAREQLRLQLLQFQLALVSSTQPSQAWPDDALSGEDLALAAEWALWSGLAAQSPWPHDRLHALASRCRQAGLALLTAPLDALAAWRTLQAGVSAPRLADLPQAAGLADLHGAAPWAALYAARALHAAGDDDAAGALAKAGLAWLQGTARTTLPLPFRDAFLNRHPAHRALAALSARLSA